MPWFFAKLRSVRPSAHAGGACLHVGAGCGLPRLGGVMSPSRRLFHRPGICMTAENVYATTSPAAWLTLRQGQVQHSVYLGTDAVLIAEVRAALRKLQETLRERRAVQRQKKAIRKMLAECRAQLRRELRGGACG